MDNERERKFTTKEEALSVFWDSQATDEELERAYVGAITLGATPTDFLGLALNIFLLDDSEEEHIIY